MIPHPKEKLDGCFIEYDGFDLILTGTETCTLVLTPDVLAVFARIDGPLLDAVTAYAAKVERALLGVFGVLEMSSDGNVPRKWSARDLECVKRAAARRDDGVSAANVMRSRWNNIWHTFDPRHPYDNKRGIGATTYCGLRYDVGAAVRFRRPPRARACLVCRRARSQRARHPPYQELR